MNAPVVVIGDALIDELRDDRGVREFVGGAALNVAVGLARLGVPTALIAMVGDDEPGSRIASFLNDYGVKLLRSPAPLGSSRAVSTRGPGGEPVYEFNHAAQERAVRYGEAERAALAAAPAVVVSCFPFDNEEQTAALAAALVDAPAPFIVDPNPRAGMLRSAADFVAGFASVVPQAEIVKVGEDDAVLLGWDSLDAMAEELRELGADVVLATRGSAGAEVLSSQGTVLAPIAHLPGPVVDTMGAGDASLASLTADVREGLPSSIAAWEEVLTRAMLVAAATVRAPGALLRLPESVSNEVTAKIDT